MDAISIAMSFTVFGILGGAGLFLVVVSARSFFARIHVHQAATTGQVTGMTVGGLGEVAGGIFNVVMAIIGVGLLLQGLLWPYIMIFR